MAEYSANAAQIVNPGETVVFTFTSSACKRKLIQHNDGTGTFLLSGWTPPVNGCGCCCNSNTPAEYLVDFGANISVPTGGTAGAISLAITVDGSTVPASTMIVTPAAVEEYFNVARSMTVDIFNGCCQTVAVHNTSDQPIQVQNANIRFSRPDLLYSR